MHITKIQNGKKIGNLITYLIHEEIEMITGVVREHMFLCD